ncbi:MAG: FHA domain-containing protein, partial [Myxococcota bacterium]
NAPAPPRLVVTEGAGAGRLELPPPPSRLVVGRDASCDLTLADADCSREHVELVHDLDGVLLRDLGSKNGTFRNGHEVREARLKDGDELRLGATWLAFEDEAEALRREALAAADAAYEPPPDPEPEPVSAPSDPPIDPAAIPAAPKAPKDLARTRARPSADLFLYLLAGTVLALSLAGLVWLLRA